MSQKLLAQYLATELDKSVKEITTALDKFVISMASGDGSSNATTVKQPVAKKVVSSETKDQQDAHTCVRVKKGQTEKCGKPAKRSIERNGKVSYYCGAEKSGCYATELKVVAQSDLDNEAGKKVSTSKAPTAKNSKVKVGNASDRKSESDSKTESLLKKINPKKKFLAKSITTKSHGKLYYDIDTRFLLDNTTFEVYGLLGKDNETIEKLTDDHIRQLEASGHTIKNNPYVSKKEPIAVVADKVMDDDEKDELSSDGEMSSDGSEDDEEEPEGVVTSETSE